MKKYLLSFLLISLTIIGDGYAGSCKAYSKRDTYKNTDNDFLDLMCEENKKTEAVSDGYTVDDVEKFDYWGIDCVTDSNSCADNQHVIVWGKHKKGNEQGVYTGVDIYRCIDKGDDEWDALTKGYDKAYQLINDCGSTVDGMTKVVSTNGYDIYVRVIDAFSKCETRAYTFASMSSSYICKKAADVADKKCGKSPSAVTANTSAFFCLEEDQVNVYQNLHGKWQKRDDVNVSVCTNSPSGNGWKKVGAYHDLFLFTNNDAWNPLASFGGVFGEDNTVVQHIQHPNEYCLWCEDTNMTPKEKEGGGYECVNETGDDTGGDSSAELQVEQEICGGVQCNSGMNGKSISCAEKKDDTYVYKCNSGQWSEVGVNGYCCNKNCSKPKKTNLVLGGSWTTDTGHEMWFNTTARISEIAWLFNSTDVNNNCTACEEGTKYNKNSEKCEQ